MPSLLHWKLPKSRSGRRSMKVTTLLAKDKAGTLFHKHGTGGHDDVYIDGPDPGVTGLPALLRRKRLETAARDDVDPNPYPKTEERGNVASTTTIGELAAPSGFSDMGKTSSPITIKSAALETLGQLSRSWEVPTDDSPSEHGGHTRGGSGGLVEAVSPSRSIADEGQRGPFRLSLGELSAQSDQDEMGDKRADARFHKVSRVVDNTGMDERTAKLAQVFHQGFLDELVKLSAAQGIELVSPELLKEAISFAGIGQGVRSAVGALRPAAAAMPEVAAMRKGMGFFSTGMGRDLTAGGKMLAHNAPAAGQAAGLAARDVGALGAMRPTSAGRRIAGETAMGAGHHMQHAGPGLLAMNPVGVPMGGAIEGFTRGVGKELQGAGNQGLQAAGHALVRHAPKVGYGGELVAGMGLPVTGLAGVAGHQLGGAVAHHLGGAAHQLAHGVGAHALGAGVQEASLAAPRLLPRVGQAVGNVGMGLKARAGHWGGKLVGA